jgi:hypothetical protein
MKEEERHIEHASPRLAPSRVRRVSWGAIFAGLFVTMVIQLMLSLLGAAIGAASINPAQGQTPGKGLALGSGIWLLASGLISVWVGACVSGRLSGGPRRADGMLHGIVTWSVSTLTMVLLLATATGAIVGGTSVLVKNVMASSQNLGQSQAGQTAMTSIGDQIRNAFPQAGALLPPTGRTEGQQVPGNLTALAQQDSDLATALTRLESKGGISQAPQERDQVVMLLTSKHNLSQQDASTLVTQWDQQYQNLQAQAGQTARQAGQVAAEGISQGALWAFIALALGLVFAAWGGWAGTASLPQPTEAAAVPSR